MPIRTIALALFTGTEAEWLIPAAATLCRGLGAHLTGVHPSETLMPYYGGPMGYMPVAEPMLLDWQVAEGEAISKIFDQKLRGETFAAEYRGQQAGALGADVFLLETARAADLILMGRTDHKEMRSEDIRLQERVIRDSGRPVLLLPKGKEMEGQVSRALIGWSGTREAARAAHDAMALLAPGATVDLLQVHGTLAPGDLTMDSRQDFAAALDRHGFRANILDRDAPAGETGETLLKAAAETGAQLVATGAFGHSRSYDFVIGAASRYLLNNAEVPLLLSK